MKITKKWLDEKRACSEGVAWWLKNKQSDPKKLLNLLIKKDRVDWANWLIVRGLDYKGYVSYAVFAAEQGIEIYEEKHPDDKRPREAIEKAKACIDDPSEKNKSAAADAAAYAADAAYAAYAVNSAYAADAADAAAYAADAAAYAADAAYAAYAVNSAYAADAADAAYAAREKMRIKILRYGIGILPEGD